MSGYVKPWINVVRVKFFLAGIPSIILGTCLAYYYYKVLNIHVFLLTFLGVSLAMAGCYTFNEYFDWRSGVDIIVDEKDITPFNAGSRMLPLGLLNPKTVFKAGFIFYMAAIAIGLYLTLICGFPVLVLMLLGIFTGALYCTPPFMWAYRGIGEFLIGLSYGPLIVLGSFYVQTLSLLLREVIISSLIPGILITLVIWINEFPDYEADRKAGKLNLVVRIGRERAKYIYYLLVGLTYLIVMVGVTCRVMPSASLIVLATIPLAIRNCMILSREYVNSRRLIPAMSGTLILFISASLLLSLGYIVGC
ncbi:MAG: prenyltransferase [Candidatus Methanomethylicia archaeon]